MARLSAPENVAMPAAAVAVTDAPLERCAPVVPVPPVICTVMPVLKVVSVLPRESRAVTWTGGAIFTPAVAAVGCVVNASCVALPGLMVNAELGPPLIAPAVADRV